MRSDAAPAHQMGRFIALQVDPEGMIVRSVGKSGLEQRQIDAPLQVIHIIRIAAENKAGLLTLGLAEMVLLYCRAGCWRDQHDIITGQPSCL